MGNARATWRGRKRPQRIVGAGSGPGGPRSDTIARITPRPRSGRGSLEKFGVVNCVWCEPIRAGQKKVRAGYRWAPAGKRNRWRSILLNHELSARRLVASMVNFAASVAGFTPAGAADYAE